MFWPTSQYQPPLAQWYGPVLAELADEFDPQGIRVVGVVCEFDGIEEIAEYRAEYAIHFPFVTDGDFRLAEALDATTSPRWCSLMPAAAPGIGAGSMTATRCGAKNHQASQSLTSKMRSSTCSLAVR